jgi:hypothetical protein
MAKGIEKIVAKFCVETAVYWGNPVNDGYGGFTYDTPVEIDCRWENKTEMDIGWLSTGFPGNIRLSKASVLVTEDLDLNGVLWRGTLDTLNDIYDDISNPKIISEAYAIHRVDKIPMVFKTDEFVRTVWLYDQGK